MYIDAEVIIRVGAVIGALLTIGGVVATIIKWFLKQKQLKKQLDALEVLHQNDTKVIKEELCMLSYVLLAVLDGLKQQGCNGEVTKAHEKLSQHLNKQAHNQI